MKTLPTTLLALALALPAAAQEALEIKTDADRISYSLGYQIGGDFKRQGVEMRPDAVVRGISDALSGAQPLMSPDEMHETLVELKRKVTSEQQGRRGEEAEKRRAEGRTFLEENAKKEGVVALPSGLQYRVISEGTGRAPGPQDRVRVHYTGTLIDGSVFDSSVKRGKPATFPLNGVIKGWTEGLQLMKEGGKAQLFIPPQLAYGDRGPLADRTLIFEVELVSVGEAPAGGADAGAESAATQPATATGAEPAGAR
jgi:FKBP-type peptidyl-prolyl cis-trans isomerase FklB